ncbi:MAG: hypothetical protein HY681_05805 [Chloroflexi bacterium]|nr:hypothetical protein [Chloroflexota bacterium]
MKILQDSETGRRLRRYGVASRALSKTAVWPLRWLPAPAFTIPVPFGGCVILARRGDIQIDDKGEIADTRALASLVHQYIHAYQRLEWGFFPYVLRHAWARLTPGGVPLSRRQVERECFMAVREVEEEFRLDVRDRVDGRTGDPSRLTTGEAQQDR